MYLLRLESSFIGHFLLMTTSNKFSFSSFVTTRQRSGLYCKRKMTYGFSCCGIVHVSGGLLHLDAPEGHGRSALSERRTKWKSCWLMKKIRRNYYDMAIVMFNPYFLPHLTLGSLLLNS